MPASDTFFLLGKAIKRNALTWALPQLAQLPPAQWDSAVKQAREMPFDAIERIAMIAGTAFTTYLLRFAADGSESALPLRFAAQFLAAVPVLILCVGPFYLRCMRRGLEQFIQRRHLVP